MSLKAHCAYWHTVNSIQQALQIGNQKQIIPVNKDSQRCGIGSKFVLLVVKIDSSLDTN